MSTVSQKYLKDEDGNIISPVTSSSSVFDRSGYSMDTICCAEGRIDTRQKMSSGNYKYNYTWNFDDSSFRNTNVSTNNSTNYITIDIAGVYLVNLILHTTDTYGYSDIVRVFSECEVTNNGTNSICEDKYWRGKDTRYLSNDPLINDMWLINLSAGAKIRFWNYFINSSSSREFYVYAYGDGEPQYTTRFRLTRLCDLPNV